MSNVGKYFISKPETSLLLCVWRIAMKNGMKIKMLFSEFKTEILQCSPDLISIWHFGVWKYGPDAPPVLYRLWKYTQRIETSYFASTFQKYFHTKVTNYLTKSNLHSNNFKTAQEQKKKKKACKIVLMYNEQIGEKKKSKLKSPKKYENFNAITTLILHHIKYLINF